MVRLVFALLACALVLWSPEDVGDLPPEKFHEEIPKDLQILTKAERKLGETITEAFARKGGAVPELDWNIVAACRRLCTVLDCSQMDSGNAWEPQTIQHTLRLFGITDAFYFPLVAQVPSGQDAHELLAKLVEEQLYTMGLNRYGLALDIDTGMLAAVFTRRLAQMGPFPRSVEPGSTHLLWGGLEGASHSPLFMLSTSEGSFVKTVPKSSKGIFWTEVFFPEVSGRYMLEVLVHVDGPQVASLFPVYVGQDVPPRPVFKMYPGVDEDAGPRQLERLALDLVNKERKKRGLGPLKPHRRLGRSCREHSQAMATAGRMSHEVGQRDPSLGAYTENISLSTTLTGAHANLMGSPSHQRNIVDDEARYCGIGIVQIEREEGSRLLFMTQRFSRNR